MGGIRYKRGKAYAADMAAYALAMAEDNSAQLGRVRRNLLRALKEAKFQDYLVFEFRAQPPADAAKAGLDYIRSLL